MAQGFSIVVATDSKNGIGINGNLPWRLSEDMKHFRDLTTGKHEYHNAVIMGRKTWESIPSKFRPLPKRQNIVLSRNPEFECPGLPVTVLGSFDTAVQALCSRAFVIGGSEIYKEALDHPQCEDMYITRVRGEFECDTFFPPFEKIFYEDRLIMTLNEGGILYSIEHWLRR